MINTEALNRLPMIALVAIAVRCARRIAPLARMVDTGSYKTEWLASIDRALGAVEQFVATGAPAFSPHVSECLTNSGKQAGCESVQLCHSLLSTFDAAVNSACHADLVDRVVERDGVASATAQDAQVAAKSGAMASAIGSAIQARRGSLQPTEPELRRFFDAVIRDIVRLGQLGLGTYPDRGAPVDASGSGPLGALWPNGTPSWPVSA